MTRLARMAVWFAVLLSAVGAFLSANLLAGHIGGKAGGLLAPLCGGESKGCDVVLASRWAVFPPAPPEGPEGETGGPHEGAAEQEWDAADGKAPQTQTASGEVARIRRVPVALLGLCYFAYMTAWLVFVGRPSWDRRWWHALPTLLALAGCGMSAWFIGVMYRLIGAWCPLCLAAHLVNFGLLLLVVLCRPRRDKASAAAHGSPPIGVSRPHPTLRLSTAVLFLGAALCASGWQLTATATLRAENRELSAAVRKLRGDVDMVLLAHYQQPRHDIPVRQDDPIIPAMPGKRMTLVLFSDLQCPQCQKFEKKLANEILPMFELHLRVVFKHFPICTECNPHAKTNLHPLACEAAFLAEAARMQGGALAFWKVRGLLKPQSKPWTAQDVIRIADQINAELDKLDKAGRGPAWRLDPARLERDRHSEAVKARVLEDIELGKSLGVEATPTGFVNGRQVDRLAMDLAGFWKQLAGQIKQVHAASARPDEPAGGSGSDE